MSKKQETQQGYQNVPDSLLPSLLLLAHHADITPLLMGPAGIGKTTAAYQLAEMLTLARGETYTVKALTQPPPYEEIIGFPDKRGDEMRYIPFPKMPTPSDRNVIALFDELPRGSPEVISALLECAFSRQLPTGRLDKSVFIMIGANPPDGSYHGRAPDVAGYSRVWYVPVEGTMSNALSFMEKDGFAPEVIAFCKMQEKSLYPDTGKVAYDPHIVREYHRPLVFLNRLCQAAVSETYDEDIRKLRGAKIAVKHVREFDPQILRLLTQGIVGPVLADEAAVTLHAVLAKNSSAGGFRRGQITTLPLALLLEAIGSDISSKRFTAIPDQKRCAFEQFTKTMLETATREKVDKLVSSIKNQTSINMPAMERLFAEIKSALSELYHGTESLSEAERVKKVMIPALRIMWVFLYVLPKDMHTAFLFKVDNPENDEYMKGIAVIVKIVQSRMPTLVNGSIVDNAKALKVING